MYQGKLYYFLKGDTLTKERLEEVGHPMEWIEVTLARDRPPRNRKYPDLTWVVFDHTMIYLWPASEMTKSERRLLPLPKAVPHIVVSDNGDDDD